MENEFESKKKSLISLLDYIDSQGIWNAAKYLIKYINESDKVDKQFINLLSKLISEAVNNAKNVVDKQKLEKIFNFMDKMKDEELKNKEIDENNIDDLLSDLYNI